MKPNSIHIEPGALFSQCDNRWIIEVIIYIRTLCDYFIHFLK